MRLCIFGGGAVGGHLAARLAAAGEEVSVIARGAHLQAVQENGIRLLHGTETIEGKVRASERAAELGPQDFVVVTLKANLLEAFAEGCAPLLGRDTAVVFVQNGIPWWYARELAFLDPGGRLARAVAPERVLGGVAYSANEIVAPGVIKNNVPGNNMLVVGEAALGESPRLEALRRALERCGLSSPPSADIRCSIWAKLLQNLGSSALCTLTGANLAELRGDAELNRLAVRVAAEGRAIAAALGVDVGRAPPRPGGGQSSGMVSHKPSMLQDFERGKPMEIDAQLRSPLELGRRAGVPVPTLEALAALCARKAAVKGLYRDT